MGEYLYKGRRSKINLFKHILPDFILMQISFLAMLATSNILTWTGIIIVFTVTATNQAIQVRLVGEGKNGKRVELSFGGGWGTVCADTFHNNDAKVICRMAAEPSSGAIATNNAFLGEGKTTLWWRQYAGYEGCDGSERTLADCSSFWNLSTYCPHNKEAAVMCVDERVSTTLPSDQVGGLLGGVIGGIAVTLVAVSVFILWRRHSRNHIPNSEQERGDNKKQKEISEKARISYDNQDLQDDAERSPEVEPFANNKARQPVEKHSRRHMVDVENINQDGCYADIELEMAICDGWYIRPIIEKQDRYWTTSEKTTATCPNSMTEIMMLIDIQHNMIVSSRKRIFNRW